MAEDGIRQLVAAGESESVEFKTSLADSRKLIETAAAMATRGGGTILVGVRNDGVPVGANVGEGEVERLVQQVLAATDPRLYLRIDEPIVEGRRLLRIEVPPGDGPHLAFGRAFHRVGRATVAMSRDEYERRLLDRLRESSGFERRRLEGATTAQLDSAAVRTWARLARSRLVGLDPEASAQSIAERLHVATGPAVTIAGWLLFAREPEGVFPQALIRAHAVRGAAEDAQAFGGPLCAQLDAAAQFVARNLKVKTRVKGTRRSEIAELPELAIREVLANAVAHRDYRSTAATQVRLTDQGLEVWNPGHLPPPITPALLRERHPSVPPNPLIARALYQAGYVEEWGTGTLKVIEAMHQNGNPGPVFDASDGAGLRVTLPLLGAESAGLTPRQAKVLKAFAKGASFRSADYAKKAGVSLRTAGLELKSLEGAGVVVRRGVGRTTRWARA
jgi:ATP-dependent DNA helicase RecG